MEQKIENDSQLEVGNERRETIKGNSIAVLEAEDQRTVKADRKVELKANDYLQVASSSHTRVGHTVAIEAGQQVHLKTTANVILDAGASITLSAGGQHIVMGPGGIFSSTDIQIGGTPVPGAVLQQAVPTELAALHAPVLPLTQRKALLAKKPVCVVCQAAIQQGEQTDA
ncbi:type VI secretion system Vgr family protein [Pseudomonas alkylphenolica]|uniref:Type VI secretion system Vgr family protein n=1 Tax=Pseudomonas alkylphenolica TaxID=237609 RepID=A0A077FB36_9PSED|nr:type VI secretion system Vgr family protein [Pseudomonas alkylphenolica]